MIGAYRLNTVHHGRLVGVYTLMPQELRRAPARLPILTFRPDNHVLHCSPQGGLEAFLRRPLTLRERAASGSYQLVGAHISIDWLPIGDGASYEARATLSLDADRAVRELRWGDAELCHVEPWGDAPCRGRFVRIAPSAAVSALAEEFELREDATIRFQDGRQGTYGHRGSWLRLVFDHTTDDFFVGLIAAADHVSSEPPLLLIGDMVFQRL